MEKDKEENPIPDQSTNEVNKVVHTYAEDMAEFIKDDRKGLVKNIIHGEEARQREKSSMSLESRVNRFFMVMSLLLVSTALVTLFFFVFTKDDDTTQTGRQFVPLIFSDKNSFLEIKDLKPEEVIEKVREEVNTVDTRDRGVKGIYLSLNKKVVPLRAFIDLIEGALVLEDISSGINLVSDNFLMGAVKSQSEPGEGPEGDYFILLKTRSMPDIFGALRDWEENMFRDLHGFFGVELSSDTKYLLTKDFQDSIVINKNARILYDEAGEIVMMYVFVEDTSVVITHTISATNEIMLRLASSQIKK